MECKHPKAFVSTYGDYAVCGIGGEKLPLDKLKAEKAEPKEEKKEKKGEEKNARRNDE